MLAFRYVAAMSTGAALVLGYAVPGTAQTPPLTATESDAPEQAELETAAVLPVSVDPPPPRDEVALSAPPLRAESGAATIAPVAGRRRTAPAAATADRLTQRADEVLASAPTEPSLAASAVPPLFEDEREAVLLVKAAAETTALAMPGARHFAAASTTAATPQPLMSPILALAAEPDRPAARSRAADEPVAPVAIARPQPPIVLAATADVPATRSTEIAPPVAPSLAAQPTATSDRRAPSKLDAAAARPALGTVQAIPFKTLHERADWLAQADAPSSAPADELSAPVEPLTPTPEQLPPQPGETGVRDNAAPLAQPLRSPTNRQAVPPPDFLDPNTNPLLFPTEPDEVTVDLTQPITLEEAIALARRNNQDFRNAWLNLEKAQAGLRAALAALYPTLDATATISRTDSAQAELSNRGRQDSALSDLLGNQESDTITDSFDGRVELSYNLYDGGRRPARIREAERAIRFNQLEVERIAEQIRLQATNAYYALQEADARVGIEQAAVENAQQTLRDAELLEQAGLGTRFDVLRAQVSLANSNQALTNALSTQRVAGRDLVRVLGLGQQVAVTIADEIELAGEWELPLEETIALAYRNRAELEQQLVQREIDAQQREAALADIRPQVSIFANYNVLGVFNDSEGLADGYQLGARVSWRFFDGGLARARSDQEALDMEIAEVTFEQRRNQVRFEVEEAYSNLRASSENIKTAEIAVQLAEESLRLARLRFQAGVGTQTDVIDAQTELTRARGNLLTAIIGYNSALASLQRAVSNLPTQQLFDLP